MKNFKQVSIKTILSLCFLLCASKCFSEERIMKPILNQAVMQTELNLEQAKLQVVNQLFQGDIGNRALFAHPEVRMRGTKIASWREPSKLVVDDDSWFFFVDEQPGANWEHKANYIVVNKKTGAMRSIPSMTPPMDVMECKPLNQVAELQMSTMKSNLQILRHIESLEVKPIKISIQKRYAVLVSGGWNAGSNYSRYWNDLQFIYKALKEKYGYTDAEIFVLYANGTHSPNEDLDGDGIDDVDYAATKPNLTTVINTIAAQIPVDGKFFFYSTNHGGQESGYDAILYLWGQWIRDDELAVLSKKLKCAEAIYTMEQCYSGGMMDDLLKAQKYPCGQPEVCVMTAAKYDEVSWACDSEGNYDEYVYHWTSAVYGKTPTGTPVNADTNGDGKVSMTEAHEYAKTHDSRNEHPQIGSCKTGACDKNLFSKITIKP